MDRYTDGWAERENQVSSHLIHRDIVWTAEDHMGVVKGLRESQIFLIANWEIKLTQFKTRES